MYRLQCTILFIISQLHFLFLSSQGDNVQLPRTSTLKANVDTLDRLDLAYACHLLMIICRRLIKLKDQSCIETALISGATQWFAGIMSGPLRLHH